MNDRQIRCFLAVSQTGSFTKAAEQLYLPQPAISRYILALEKGNVKSRRVSGK